MITVDETAWPRVELHYAGPLTNDDVDAFQATMGRYLDRGERFAVVVATAPDRGRERGLAKRQLGWTRREGGRLARHLAGMAVVAAAPGRDPAPFARAKAQVSKLASLLPYPQRVFASLDEARAWTAERLSDDT